MKQTLVAMFDTQSAALAAKQRLLARGIAAWAIQITDAQPATGDTAASTSATTTATTPSPGETGVLASVQRFFADLFSGGDDDVHAYSDAVQRGGALLKVEVDDDTELDMARDELGQAGAADIDERLDSWRRARAATGGSETTSRTSDATTAVASDADRQGVIPVVQESVAVGKRSLRAGGLRVYARVVEEPVRESVTLREERATVDRRPVDRPATQAELTGMAERTIEVTEMVERPVVEKTARVVEEVVVGKDVRQTRTTVEETARHTEVEVQTLAGDAAASSLSVDDRLDREDFERHFGTSGQRFEDVRPAYAFGRSLRGEDRYTGLSWDEVEPQARQRWASTYPDSPWERTKDAVRRSWDRLTE